MYFICNTFTKHKHFNDRGSQIRLSEACARCSPFLLVSNSYKLTQQFQNLLIDLIKTTNVISELTSRLYREKICIVTMWLGICRYTARWLWWRNPTATIVTWLIPLRLFIMGNREWCCLWLFVLKKHWEVLEVWTPYAAVEESRLNRVLAEMVYFCLCRVTKQHTWDETCTRAWGCTCPTFTHLIKLHL
jgi:hypothetical protein